MFFHWLRAYGGAKADATALADKVMAGAKAAAPRVFAADSALEPARQAKFEWMCVFLALETAKLKPRGKRGLLEEMVDRLEVGLREAGVGDMTVGKQVRTYAAAMNGRLLRYEPLILKGKMDGLVKATAKHGVALKGAKEVEKRLARGA